MAFEAGDLSVFSCKNKAGFLVIERGVFPMVIGNLSCGFFGEMTFGAIVAKTCPVWIVDFMAADALP